LAAAAEPTDEEEDAVPEQETAVIDDALRAAWVGGLVEPGVELWEEVPDGAGEGRPDVQ
jgi:hypothetical protein